MNTDHMSNEELRNYILSLLDKMDIHQLRLAVVYLQDVVNKQEGDV